ncbi:MAG: 30S ribosomal protein S28e [Candidatus Nanohalarchaeota archaeon]|nr:MAG: 30S ribosomal protein S28e [Candidatus Nanohaloarchaeota archaeon]
MADTVLSEVLEILEHSETKGVTKVKCIILDGENKNKVLVRNVIGPIRKKDILILPRIDIESGRR